MYTQGLRRPTDRRAWAGSASDRDRGWRNERRNQPPARRDRERRSGSALGTSLSGLLGAPFLSRAGHGFGTGVEGLARAQIISRVGPLAQICARSLKLIRGHVLRHDHHHLPKCHGRLGDPGFVRRHRTPSLPTSARQEHGPPLPASKPPKPWIWWSASRRAPAWPDWPRSRSTPGRLEPRPTSCSGSLVGERFEWSSARMVCAPDPFRTVGRCSRAGQESHNCRRGLRAVGEGRRLGIV